MTNPNAAAPVLLAVDGNSLAHRAYHAYERSGMTNTAGQPVWTVYGFGALLAGICDKTGPDALVVGFDADAATSARRSAYPDYKANRAPKDDALSTQLDAIAALLVDLGVSVVVADGWEADDVVGSAAAAAEAAGWRAVIATSDRDAFALITEQTAVLRLVSGLDNAQWLTPDALVDRYGVRPQDYLSYAALRGDRSDNLPGVDGIGEKTAARLLAATTVEAALADPAVADAAIGRAYAAKLAAGAADWRRNLEIMAIRRDLPIDLDAARLPAADAATITRTLAAWGLPGLARRLTGALAGAEPSPARPAGPVRPGWQPRPTVWPATL